jgi:hypothetical protein
MPLTNSFPWQFSRFSKRFIPAAILLASLTGCAPSPPKPVELGRVIYDPAQVPGMDNPYQLPESEQKEDKHEEKGQGQEPAGDGEMP